jgi:hypothetical protein
MTHSSTTCSFSLMAVSIHQQLQPSIVIRPDVGLVVEQLISLVSQRAVPHRREAPDRAVTEC